MWQYFISAEDPRSCHCCRSSFCHFLLKTKWEALPKAHELPHLRLCYKAGNPYRSLTAAWLVLAKSLPLLINFLSSETARRRSATGMQWPIVRISLQLSSTYDLSTPIVQQYWTTKTCLSSSIHSKVVLNGWVMALLSLLLLQNMPVLSRSTLAYKSLHPWPFFILWNEALEKIIEQWPKQ